MLNKYLYFIKFNTSNNQKYVLYNSTAIRIMYTNFVYMLIPVDASAYC